MLQSECCHEASTASLNCLSLTSTGPGTNQSCDSDSKAKVYFLAIEMTNVAIRKLRLRNNKEQKEG